MFGPLLAAGVGLLFWRQFILLALLLVIVFGPFVVGFVCVAAVTSDSSGQLSGPALFFAVLVGLICTIWCLAKMFGSGTSAPPESSGCAPVGQPIPYNLVYRGPEQAGGALDNPVIATVAGVVIAGIAVFGFIGLLMVFFPA